MSVVERLELGVTPAASAVALTLTRNGGAVQTQLHVTTAAGRRPAVAGDGAITALVERWRTGTGLGAFRGTWHGDAVTGAEQQVSTDHANLSIATGEVLVKLLRRPSAAPAATVALLRHLDAVGFREVPVHLGELWWSAGDESIVVALASRYLPGGREGWRVLLDLAASHLRDGAPITRSHGALDGLGALVARFHLAVATPSSTLPRPERKAGPADRCVWRDQAAARLDAALADVAEPAATTLRDHADLLRRHLDGFAASDDPTPLVRIHGDLHVGQVLEVGGRLVLTDLDGPPDVEPGQALEGAPARDLASLLRSLDHVGRLTAHRNAPVDPDMVDAWVTAARRRCWAAYEDTLSAAGRRDLLDDLLVAPFEAAQCVHELVYATRHLPDWLPVAHDALRAFVEGRACDGP